MAKRWLVTGALVAMALATVPVSADEGTQTVDAGVASSLSMTTKPTSSISGWNLAASGSNTTSGGSIVVSANGPYSVTVTADKTRMTEYVTATSSYVATSPKTLNQAMTISAGYTTGTAAVPGVGGSAIIGTSTALATGTGGGTDSFDVTLSQPTSSSDAALPAGRTYHIVLTYTLSSTL